MYNVTIANCLFIIFATVALSDSFKINEVHIDVPSNFISGSCIHSSTEIEKTRPVGLAMCIKKCLLRVNCNVICYHKTHLSCILGHNSTALVTTTDLNFLTNLPSFMSSAKAKQTVHGACSVPCDNTGESCFHLNLGRKCLLTDHILSCGLPLAILHAQHNASLQNTHIPAGSTVKYTCDYGYAESGGNKYITCQDNGVWTLTSFSCNVPSCGTAGYVMVTSGLCAKVYNDLVNYKTARSNCASEGSVMARIDEGNKGSLMMAYTSSGLQYFIDGSDILEEGVWLYNDGTPITTTLLTEEDKSIVVNDCLVYTTMGLGTGLCDKRHPYICQVNN